MLLALAVAVAAFVLFVCAGGLSGQVSGDRATEAVLCAQRAVMDQLAPEDVAFVPFGQTAQRRSDGSYAVSGGILRMVKGRRVRSLYAAVVRPSVSTGRMACERCLVRRGH